MSDKIFMHFPIEIEKAEDGSYKRVIVKGKASTPHQDKQGEWIDPMGCDIADFKRISDDHIKGNSGTIGEIIKAHKDHEAVWIDEAELYSTLPQVQHIVKLADAIKKNPNSKMQLSFSVEGSATERDMINPKRILKAKFTGAAVTFQPINPNATAELFAKSLNYDDTDFDALEKSEAVNEKRYLYEWTDKDGNVCKLNKSFDIEIEKSQKANIGDIHVWNGKKFKKQSNGKWMEVSVAGLSNKEHKDKAKDYLLNAHKSHHPKGNEELADQHQIIAASVSDKEYSDEEIGVGQHYGSEGEDKEDDFGLSKLDRYSDYYDVDQVAKKIANRYIALGLSKDTSDNLIKLMTFKSGAKTHILPDLAVKRMSTFLNEIKKRESKTQKSTTAELVDDDSEDILKKEELKKKTVSLITKAIEEKRISKEKGKKMLKHFLNQ